MGRRVLLSYERVQSLDHNILCNRQLRQNLQTATYQLQVQSKNNNNNNNDNNSNSNNNDLTNFPNIFLFFLNSSFISLTILPLKGPGT